ncbi:hypothetical protein FRC08_007485 [Ceratobasidium sp. 394]|nr:hypothetical protein FRC08_007485 [Ceratobasidium sp. 394]
MTNKGTVRCRSSPTATTWPVQTPANPKSQPIARASVSIYNNRPIWRGKITRARMGRRIGTSVEISLWF